MTKLIDVDILKAIICNVINEGIRRNRTKATIQKNVIYAIDNAPTVSIDWGIDDGDRTIYARPQGKWIDHYYPHFEVAGIECSVCGKDVEYWERHYDLPNFCPNCGASMTKENKE